MPSSGNAGTGRPHRGPARSARLGPRLAWAWASADLAVRAVGPFLASDREGGLWIGLYGGSEVRRYSTAGEVLERVRFPVSNITKIAFGGSDHRTAFATTARHLLNDEKLARQPLAGALFAFPVDVSGIPCPLVAD